MQMRDQILFGAAGAGAAGPGTPAPAGTTPAPGGGAGGGPPGTWARTAVARLSAIPTLANMRDHFFMARALSLPRGVSSIRSDRRSSWSTLRAVTIVRADHRTILPHLPGFSQ